MSMVIKGICYLEITPNAENRGKFESVSTSLVLPDEFEPSAYFCPDGSPNETGLNTLTNVLVAGLIGNIHYAHQAGLIDSAKHVRRIMDMITQGFIDPMDSSKVLTDDKGKVIKKFKIN